MSDPRELIAEARQFSKDPLNESSGRLARVLVELANALNVALERTEEAEKRIAFLEGDDLREQQP